MGTGKTTIIPKVMDWVRGVEWIGKESFHLGRTWRTQKIKTKAGRFISSQLTEKGEEKRSRVMATS